MSGRVFDIGGVRVEVAETAGFCFGVDRAVKTTEALLDAGRSVATLGPLIHNPGVVAALAARGAVAVEGPGDVPPGSVAVIRSHGVPPAVKTELDARGIETIDATCPFVSKIHALASRAKAENAVLFVAGDREHPEVQGIVGHAGADVVVFANFEELRDKMAKFDCNREIWAVAQTTYEVTKWLECVDFLKKVCTKCVVFDTICNATLTRQEETAGLGSRCDLIVVAGGAGSSNTRKLLAVAGAHTRAVLVERPEEVANISFKGVKRVGVTAGASTPSSLIEEVLARMSDAIHETEMSFEEMLDDSMKPVYAGQIVKGVVEAVSANEVTVDIGTKHTGIVKLEELTDDPAVRSAEDVVKRDDEMELVVVKVSDQDGIVYLSRRQMEARKGAEEVAKAAEEGTVMEGYVVEANKGGLVANVKGVKVFIPASQATARRGDDYKTMVRQHVKLKIKEFSPRRTIGSIRDVLSEEQAAQREQFWQDVEVGKRYVGTVKSLTSYGAFVDVGGVDGLVHISELSWNRVKHPSEVLNVGDTVEVYVKDLDPENKKVSLGYKKQEDNPWEKLKTEYPVGSTFTAPVVSLTKFGAFVRILPGVDGLVHISEISHDRVEKVQDALNVGDEVEVQLIDVDYDRKRISLSMKSLLPEPEKPAPGDADEVVASASSDKTEISEKLEESMADAKDMMDNLKEKAQDFAADAKEAAGEALEKAGDLAQQAKEAAAPALEKAQEFAKEAAEKAGDMVDDLKEKVGDMMNKDDDK